MADIAVMFERREWCCVRHRLARGLGRGCPQGNSSALASVPAPGLHSIRDMASTAADDMRAKRRDGLYTNTEMLGIMAMVGVLTAVAVAYGSALLGAPVPPAINDAALAAAHAAHRAELATITSRMNDMAASMFDLRSALVKQLAREQPACNCPASSAAPSTAQPPHVATAFDSGAAVNARVTEANAPATEAVDTKLGHSTALPDIDSDGRPNRFGIDDLRDKFNVKVAHRVVCRCHTDRGPLFICE